MNLRLRFMNLKNQFSEIHESHGESQQCKNLASDRQLGLRFMNLSLRFMNLSLRFMNLSRGRHNAARRRLRCRLDLEIVSVVLLARYMY